MEIRDRAPPGKEYRRLRNQVSSMVKRDKLRTNLDKLRKSHNDPKVLWGLANAALGKPLNASLPTSLLVNGIATTRLTKLPTGKLMKSHPAKMVAAGLLLLQTLSSHPDRELLQFVLAHEEIFNSTARHHCGHSRPATCRPHCYHLPNHLPRGEYLRQLARLLFIGVVGYGVAAVVTPCLKDCEASPSNAHKAVQVALNDVARTITGKSRQDHVQIADLLHLAGLPSFNELAVRASVMEAWTAFRISDGFVIDMDVSTASMSLDELRSQFNQGTFEDLDESCDVPAMTCGPSSGSNRAEHLNIPLSPYCEYDLKTPGFDQDLKYPDGDYSCAWSFQSNHPMGVIRIRVEPTNFDLGGATNQDCSQADSLMIEGIQNGATDKAYLCGKLDKAMDFISKGKAISMKFNKLSAAAAKGFKVKIIADKNLY
eukprot:maker-scaffold509_size151631-snap-gene-0.18 protein:Tk05955 transcript:maker-scaffold509_size151631-snap-gene-0.18-mRNA-1 annotation:"hypothetical protein T265_04194"